MGLTDWMRDILTARLGPGAVFVDVGANVGEVAGFARSLGAEVWAFEPVPEYFADLAALDVHAENVALGRALDMLPINVGADGNKGWNTMVPGFMPEADVGRVEYALVRNLDSYRLRPDVVKIDTEGFELPVLEGACDTLERSCPLLIVEVAPAAYPLLGRSIAELIGLVEGLGYRTDTDVAGLQTTTDVIWERS